MLFRSEEGRAKWQARQTKWLTSFKKQNYSKVSQELFDSIMTHHDSTDVYYATFERPEMVSYSNKEFRLRLDTKTICPDFIDTHKKRIIEFDGDYWHSDAKVNPTRARERDALVESAGYRILHIREQDYKKDKQGTIDKCIQFLNQ